MKKIKIYHEKYLLRKRKKLLRNKIRRTAKRKKIRLEKIHKKIKERKLGAIRNTNKGKIKRIEAPANFSLINNPELLLKYFNDNGKLLNKGYIVDFDLSNVDNLTFDAVALLMAKIKDPDYTQGSSTQGNAPNKPDLQYLFKSTNFYKYVTREVKEDIICSGDMLHHVSSKKVNEDISDELALVISPEKNYQGLYGTLMECMQNTGEHAGVGLRKIYNWWAIYDIDKNNNIARICFIDLGIGILGSLKDWRSSILNRFAIETESERLSEILKGNIEIPSRTRKQERGTGLQQIYNFSKRNEILKSVLITNKVYVDMLNEKYVDMTLDFSGTFFYWEIDITKI